MSIKQIGVFCLAITTLAATLLAAGCGYHLRGQRSLPEVLSPMHVQYPENTERAFRRSLNDQLRVNGVELTEDADAADFRLVIQGLQQTRRVASLAPNATVAEYEIRITATYSMFDDTGVTIIDKATAVGFQNFDYDENIIVGKEREEVVVRQAVFQIVAQRVAFQLSPYDELRISQIQTDALANQDQPKEQ